MITIDHTKHVVSVAVLGEFTLGDFRELEALIATKLKAEGPISLYLDFREMAGFTVDMAWEEIQFTRQHKRDFDKVAVVTDSQWVAWTAWLNQAFVSADVRVFGDDIEAREWLEEEAA